MKSLLNSRQAISVGILLFYLIPLLFLTYYSFGYLPKSINWNFFSFGLLILSGGSLSLVFLLYYREQFFKKQLSPQHLGSDVYSQEFLSPFITQKLPEQHIQSNQNALELHELTNEIEFVKSKLKEALEQNEELIKEIQIKENEQIKFEEEKYQFDLNFEKFDSEREEFKSYYEEHLKEKSDQLYSLEQTIQDQQIELNSRQGIIQQQEIKIQDLGYEIKTLLYLHEIDPPYKQKEVSKEDSFAPLNLSSEISPQPSLETTMQFFDHFENEFPTSETVEAYLPSEASALLKNCIDLAQKITGSSFYGNHTNRYREFAPHYTIAQRHLFDSLSNETGALIILYSPREEKLLFANHYSKQFLGWAPEKLISDFMNIAKDGVENFKRVSSQLNGIDETQTHLLMKSKNGNEVRMNVHLGMIPNGLFKNYVIAILYPA